MATLHLVAGGSMDTAPLTQLEQLARDIHHDLARETSNREAWIEIQLDLCRHLFEARQCFADNTSFSHWLKSNDLGKDNLDPHKRAAAVHMGADLATARRVLEASDSIYLRDIYEKEWPTRHDGDVSMMPSQTPAEMPPRKRFGVSDATIARVRAYLEQHPDATHKQIGGALGVSQASAWRSCTALGRTYGKTTETPGPLAQPAPKRAPKASMAQRMARLDEGSKQPKYLTAQEADPNFTGTEYEFAAVHGHTRVMPATDYAKMWFRDLVKDMKILAKTATDLPGRSRNVGLDYLRDLPVADITRLETALGVLRPMMAEAEAALARAREALAARSSKQTASDQG